MEQHWSFNPFRAGKGKHRGKHQRQSVRKPWKHGVFRAFPLVNPKGFEPTTLRMRTVRSPNWHLTSQEIVWVHQLNSSAIGNSDNVPYLLYMTPKSVSTTFSWHCDPWLVCLIDPSSRHNPARYPAPHSVWNRTLGATLLFNSDYYYTLSINKPNDF